MATWDEIQQARLSDVLELQKVHKRLLTAKEQGIEPEKPPYTIREGGNRLCFVRDPDGYRIELIERG